MNPASSVSEILNHPKVRRFATIILIIGVGYILHRVYIDILTGIEKKQQIKINKQVLALNEKKLESQ